MHTLHNGGFLDEVKKIPDGSVHLVLTDLPYGTTTCAWDSIIPIVPMWQEVKRVLTPCGTFITTSSQPFTSVLVASNLEMFKYHLIWEKSKPSNFLNARNKPMPAHEEILVFSLGTTANGSERRMTYNPQMQPGTPYKKKQKTDPRVGAWEAGNRTPYIGATNINNGERFPTSVLYFANGNNDSEHPTQKPVALYDWLVLTYSNVGETILDFCFGSGTTGVSAVRNSRDFIGIEKEPAYFSIGERRIKEAVLQPSFYTLPNNRLHLDVGDSPAQQALFTPEADTAEGKLPAPAPRR